MTVMVDLQWACPCDATEAAAPKMKTFINYVRWVLPSRINFVPPRLSRTSSLALSALILSSNTDAGSYFRPSRRASSASVSTKSPLNTMILGHVLVKLLCSITFFTFSQLQAFSKQF